MRSFLTIFTATLTTAALTGYVSAGKVEVKGPHICCNQCVTIANKIVNGVAGVTDGKADQKGKTVTFTATDEAAAKAGVKALFDGGFFGSATHDGKEINVVVAPATKGAAAAVVSIKDVHVCCGLCVKAVNAVFKDAKVTYDGKGPQKTVRVEGASLDSGGVLEALRKAGFNGTPE